MDNSQLPSESLITPKNRFIKHTIDDSSAPEKLFDTEIIVDPDRPGCADLALGDGDLAMRLPSDAAVVLVSDPGIVIEIDPDISGGYLQDRFDIMIHGRVGSAAAIDEVRLQVGDWITSTTSFGQPEPAATTVPDETAVRQRYFQFNLPRPGNGRAEKCVFQIIACAESGFEYAEAFEIDVDPNTGGPVSVITGPTHKNAGAGRPHTRMYIEHGTIDPDGVLSVQGWAVSLGPTLALQIFADELRVSQARTGGDREDVAVAFPAYPNARLSGFSLTMQLDEPSWNAERIRAQIVCPNGFGHAETILVERPHRSGTLPAGHVGAEPSQAKVFAPGSQPTAVQPDLDVQATGDPPPGECLPSEVLVGASPGLALMAMGKDASSKRSLKIRMHCDAATLTSDGILSVDGWAVCGIGIVQVRIMLDDEDVGLASFGHERHDVGGIFPDIPLARLAGFRFKQSIGTWFEGRHNVRVIVRNRCDDENQTQRSVTVAEATRHRRAPITGSLQDTDRPDLTPEQASEFRFELDSPTVSKGAAVSLVNGRLTIDGWLLSRSGIDSFEIFLDDHRLGEVHYGLARQDVGAAFPEWPNALRSGFAFHCPPRSLKEGDHKVLLRMRSNSRQELISTFRITVKKVEDQKDGVGIRRRVPRVEVDMMTALLSDVQCRPAFRFILRQSRSIEIDRLRATLEALRRQAYADWTVLILAADDHVVASVHAEIMETIPHLAGRLTLISPSDDSAWSASLACTGSPGSAVLRVDHQKPDVLYSLLLPGDEPGADALLELAVARARHPERDLLYGDEVRPSPITQDLEAFFKPDFSPDLLLSTNYIGRLWVVTEPLLAKAGATAASLVRDGEYDLLLRCSELAACVHHIPKLLCRRSAMELDDAALGQAALERALQRRSIAGEVIATTIQGTWRVKRATVSKGKVSIIIPTRASQGYVDACITSLRARTSYRDFEIICVDNIPTSDGGWKAWLRRNADKVVDVPDAFNWSVFNNRAADVADGEFLLFLNDDIEIIQEDWLDAMLEHGRRPEVGVTGPQLLYPDGTVQHAGMFLSNNGVGRHAFRFAANDDPCYFGLALTQRNVIAVTGACMLVRRDIFGRFGGFDEAHEIVNNDLDFCLRVHRAGLLTVYTPYATLTHHELASRANLKDVFDLTHFNTAWKTTFAEGDPYFNPRLSRHADDYRPDDEPVQWVVSGAPMFLPEEIRSILVVKLDHIGDFVTALPPIRRLKRLFPHARITVLAGSASQVLASLEPCIDEFIPFAFFHARSQLGECKLTKTDYAKLAEQLRPYRFDLAVDLRKHLATRDVLQHTGARFLAGFDYRGQFPYLDIALDWDGDRTLQRKRSHIIDDLLALVNAIGRASEADRVIMQPGPITMPLTELPDQVRALFAKPVVAIHPGAGNVTKQWPEEHFSALIDLLIEKNSVNVLLVGGADELEIADALLAHVQHPAAIASMTGNTSLADLPRLLKNCVLYIGNDSGPKHIAAAVGVPTIGIHSGVVDPVEWGPIGPSAVALRRNMTCSPCYLANAEDCPRSLACLRFLEPNMVFETASMLLKRPAQEIVAPDMLLPAEVKVPSADVEAVAPLTIVAQSPLAPPPQATASAETDATTALKQVRNPKTKRRQRATEPA